MAHEIYVSFSNTRVWCACPHDTGQSKAYSLGASRNDKTESLAMSCKECWSIGTDWWRHLRFSWWQLILLNNNYPEVDRSQSCSWEKWQSAPAVLWNVLYGHVFYTLVLQIQWLLGKTVESSGSRALLGNMGGYWKALMFDSPTLACPGKPRTSLSCYHTFSTKIPSHTVG